MRDGIREDHSQNDVDSEFFLSTSVRVPGVWYAPQQFPVATQP